VEAMVVDQNVVMSHVDIIGVLDLFTSASSTKPYATTDKTQYHNGIRGSFDSFEIVRKPKLIANRPIKQIEDLFKDEAIVRRVFQFELSCCKLLRYIGADAIFAACKMNDSDDSTLYLMESTNLSDKKHLVNLFFPNL
jgi:hypothetical protein